MNDYYNSITPAHLLGTPTITKTKPKTSATAFFESINILNIAITTKFGRVQKITSFNDHLFWLKDVAENYKIKLICENFKYCTFPTVIDDKKVYVTYLLKV